MVKRKGRGGQKRKTARILALEALKKAKKENINNKSSSVDTQQRETQEVSSGQNNATTPPPPPPQPPDIQASGLRQPPRQSRKGRKKKRLDEVAVTSVAPTSQQHGEKSKHEVTPINNVLQTTQWMPRKRILEFVLDILQRRDTHEIFAQPVDSNEVEGYYSIIEKPMDFGTMRAKLQEGIYTTLDQFENDVFLITNNAMHFNSSATIYFRQARAIHELAKRVFHTLKTDPRKIELEFSQTKKRPGRKRRGETGGSCFKLGAKLRRNSLAYHGSSEANPCNNEILPGSRDGRIVNCGETERRQAYMPQASIVSEESIFTTLYSSSKQLVPGNGGIGYKESLLRFAKDLGPIAQKVANQKWRCLNQISSSGIDGCTPSKGKDILISDRTDIDSGLCRGNMALGLGRKANDRDPDRDMATDTNPPRRMIRQRDKKELLVQAFGEDSAHQSQSTDSGIVLEFLTTGNKDLNGIFDYTTMDKTLGSKILGSDQVQPTHLASRSQSGLLEFFSRSNWRPKSSVYPSKVIMAPGSSQVSTLMHSLGKESNAPLDLNCSASSGQVSQPSSSQVSQPSKWSRPTPWGHRAIDDSPQIQPQVSQPINDTNRLRRDVFAQHQSGIASAPCMQFQPSRANPLGRDSLPQHAVAQNMQPLQPHFTPRPYAQPQLGMLNLLGQEVFVQPELHLPEVPYVNALGDDAYYVSRLGRDVILPPETQFGLPCQGPMISDSGNFWERYPVDGEQLNSHARFWDSQ